MGWDLHIAPENITYLYEFDLVLGPLIPGMGSKMCIAIILELLIEFRVRNKNINNWILSIIILIYMTIRRVFKMIFWVDPNHTAHFEIG